MGLADVVRKGVATGKRVVDDLLVEVEHLKWRRAPGLGEAQYEPATRYRALLRPLRRVMRTASGSERVTEHYLLFLEPVAIDVSDRFTLPDGMSGPILETRGMADTDGGSYYTEVWLGERGSTGG